MGSALRVADWLATTPNDLLPDLLADVVKRRADNAAILNLAALWETERDWGKLRAFLEDDHWCGDLGLSIAHHRTIGVPTMGPHISKVLEMAVNLGAATATLITDRRAVRWGLGYLGLPIELSKLDKADLFLLPALATHRERVWTDREVAESAELARDQQAVVTVVAHPACRLSDQTRRAYRPPSSVVDLVL